MSIFLKRNVSVSELKLDVPDENIRHNQTHRKIRRKSSEPNSRLHHVKYGSNDNVSIKTVEFPEHLIKNPVQKVKCPPFKNAPSSCADTKKPTAVTSDPSNYDLRGWVVSIPEGCKVQCTGVPHSYAPSNSTMGQNNVPLNPEGMNGTSQETKGSIRSDSRNRFKLKNTQWQKPCRESFAVGAPRPYVGTCPENLVHLARLSTNRQKFFLTQDPRKTHCLRNPEAMRKKAYSPRKGFNALTAMVEQADNACNSTASQTSESFICDVVDLENPLQLDLQGMDYKTTYQKDEQDIQNQFFFRRMLRSMEHKHIKAEAESNVEAQVQKERLEIPTCFTIINRNEQIPPIPFVEAITAGKLYRAVDKPYNRAIITEERNRRLESYKNLYLKKKQKVEEKNKEEEKARQELPLHKASNLMMKKFSETVEQIDDVIRQTNRQEPKLKRKEIQRRTFPNTLRETIAFKRDLKDKKRVERDKAKVKTEFFKERLGKVKKYPEAEMEISSDTARHSDDDRISEQSSDDADALEVGKRDQQFKLRGFHFTLGDSIRGKLHENERKTVSGHRREKGCITREKWLASLAPGMKKIKIDVEVGIEKLKDPNDPEMTLFPPRIQHKPPAEVKTSKIREYRQQKIGEQYRRMRRKVLKFVRPKLRYSVKKFSLIKFLYRDDDKKSLIHKDSVEELTKNLDKKCTQEYIDTKVLLRHKNKEKMRAKRLALLGLSCKALKRSRLQTRCEISESDSESVWVPNPEHEMTSDTDIGKSEARFNRLTPSQRGNMPAPRYRESTLRRHPRRPRNYFDQRVPSKLFGQVLQIAAVPIMHKPKELPYSYENLKMLKRPYTKMFDGRHHHDHFDPTQKSMVNVHYQVQKVVADVIQTMKKEHKKIIENFQMANPPCNAFVDMDITLPQYDVEAMIQEQSHLTRNKELKNTKQLSNNICNSKDSVFHSRKGEKLEDFSGRQEYLQFLREIRQQLQNRRSSEVDEVLFVNKEALFKELEEDLKSIESCLTSLSTSECTNLSNDSGSFLLVDGKTKVPLDYIRKSSVPFEDSQRSRFKFVPIDKNVETANHFKAMPFPGQKTDQQELAGRKDGFFTFNTRIQNGIRMRLEVPIEDVHRQLLGQGAHKYPTVFRTDIDANYVRDLKDRPPVKMFKFKSSGTMVKNALRLKFESMLIQGQIVRTKIYDCLNDQHFEQMQRTAMLFVKLFEKWEKKEYAAMMEVIYKVKNDYNVTDVMKKEFRDLERELLFLNMNIVYVEADWIRRIQLQNFHYLLADAEWRHKNDWIHRIDPNDPNSELESFDKSIAKRYTVNIRQREKDDAFAIKAFYEEQYLHNKHQLLIVFPNADSFLKGIENLKNKTFVLLLELHFTLSLYTELLGRLETFGLWCAQDLAEKKEYVARKCAKKFLLLDRLSQIKQLTLDFMKEPIEKSFNDQNFKREQAIISEVWRQIVPANIRGSSEKDFDPVDMVAMMADIVVDLLALFETLPVDECQKIEHNYRKQRQYLQKMSYQATQIEKRIYIQMKSVRKNLEPPPKKLPRKGRLPRLQIKKKPVKVAVTAKHISEHAKAFYRAFNDDDDTTQYEEDQEDLLIVDKIQERIVPFYFDHFLRINGYSPSYNFKTQVELRDGSEIDRAKVRHVLPEVLAKLDSWDAKRKKVMQDNIARHPEMYLDVNI